jgi:hypothetical protein
VLVDQHRVVGGEVESGQCRPQGVDRVVVVVPHEHVLDPTQFADVPFVVAGHEQERLGLERDDEKRVSGLDLEFGVPRQVELVVPRREHECLGVSVPDPAPDAFYPLLVHFWLSSHGPTFCTRTYKIEPWGSN